MTHAQIESLADALLGDWPRFEDESNRVALVEQDGEAGDDRMRELLIDLLKRHLCPTGVVDEDDGDVDEWNDLDPADMPRF